jgi:hypothetical protein
MNSLAFRLPMSHLFIQLHHLLNLINLKSFKGTISPIFSILRILHHVYHFQSSDNIQRLRSEEIHRLNLDLVVKEREIRLKDVARIAVVEAESVKKAEWGKSSAEMSEFSTVVQTLKADRDLLGKDIEIAQLEGEIEKLQHSAIVSKEKWNELESSNRALRKQLQTLSEGIGKAGGISANSFLNTVEKLEC